MAFTTMSMAHGRLSLQPSLGHQPRTRVQVSARAKEPSEGTVPIKKRRQRKLEEPDGAIILGISDLVLGNPPWYVFKDAPVKDIGLQAFVPSLFLSEDEDQEVKVSLKVEPVGRGYYIRGEARAELSLECSDCTAECKCQVESPVEAWLSREEYNSEDEIGPCEIPWSPQLRSVDLTSLVAAAMGEAVPMEIRCKGGCNIMPENKSMLTEAPATSGRKSKSAFGDLAKLKSSLPLKKSE